MQHPRAILGSMLIARTNALEIVRLDDDRIIARRYAVYACVIQGDGIEHAELSDERAPGAPRRLARRLPPQLVSPDLTDCR
jgi:hypothetical protein